MTLDYLLPVRASETSVQKMGCYSWLQKFLSLDSLILCDVGARWTMPSGELSPRFIFIRERVKRPDSCLPDILKINLFQSKYSTVVSAHFGPFHIWKCSAAAAPY